MIIDICLCDHNELDIDFEDNNELDLDFEIGSILSGDARPVYDGEHVITPKKDIQQTLETKDKRMNENVLVLEIPYSEVSNETGGTTAIIGGI